MTRSEHEMFEIWKTVSWLRCDPPQGNFDWFPVSIYGFAAAAYEFLKVSPLWMHDLGGKQ